jgi:hypothetical protein
MIGFIATACKADQKVHTRVGECAMFEGTPRGFIIHHKDALFPIDEASFNAAIKAGITASGINRITPLLMGLTDYQISGGDVKTSQEGFGPEVPTDINAKRIDITINKGGLCLLKQLKKYNGRQMRIFLVDKKMISYGTAIIKDGEEKQRGFLATLWAAKRDNNGSQEGAIILSVFFDANYGNEEDNITGVALAEEYEGLTGVVLKRTAPGKAKFVVACSGDDLTSTYGTTLADASLYKDSTGAAPTSVTYSSATEDLTFIPAAGSYTVADAAALDAADIEGYEGEEVYTDLT